jgi:putative NIF3 family GTP cyclohydrolase 1 type 2
MRLKEITDFLESEIPSAFQEDYDNSGLLTGNPDMEITGVLVTLDINNAVLEEAITQKCNLIVSHHPMVFRALKKFSGPARDQQLLVKAIQADIAIYTMHTNIDNAFEGLNFFVAAKLGLKDCRILQPRENFLV